jgi:glyceraldehyde 3-phosphate dehydrogenase
MGSRIAINGFGRIGRLVLRALFESARTDLQIVAINDLADAATNAHLLKYDTVHGRFPGSVKVDGDRMLVNEREIATFREREPGHLAWADLDVDVVLECSGVFTRRGDAARHLEAGAAKVLISAPSDDDDLTVAYGVNDAKLQPEHRIVSNASCTTNCLAPVAHVLNGLLGIEEGFMTTIHSYTADQRIVDSMHKDWHRARAAALNMVPTSTGAARAIGKVIPELHGKLDGTAIRVPTPNVSVVDFKFRAGRPTSVAEINDAVTAAAQGSLRGILDVYDEPLVSADFNHNPHSAIFALKETRVINGSFVRILSWYDNEWGFANRMLDTAAAMAGARVRMDRTGTMPA